MVFSGQCEIFKTKNEFMAFNEYGEEIVPEQIPDALNINSTKGFESEHNIQSALAAHDGLKSQLSPENKEEQKQKDKNKTEMNVGLLGDKESSVNKLKESSMNLNVVKETAQRKLE